MAVLDLVRGVVRAGHLTPADAYALTPRELALFYGAEAGGGQAADSPLAALQQAVRCDERRALLARLTPLQRAELARRKARLCH